MVFPRSLGPALALMLAAALLPAQQTPNRNEPGAPPAEAGPGSNGPTPGRFGPGPDGFGPPRGGMMRTERKVVEQFDKDGDHRLNAEERKAARESLKKEAAEGGGRPGELPGFPGGPRRGPGGGGPGGFGPPGFGGREEPVGPGVKILPADVKPSGYTDLYAPGVLRTMFLDFDEADWEAELEEFHGTDVEVPATLTVDGEKYPGVGVHFRGMSSYMMVRAGHKRSLNVALDFTNKKQRLDGYKTLNLLNCHEEESMMSTVLYAQIAQHYLPVPKANFVRVVLNGESWGIYVSTEQFNKDFVEENYRTSKGARWKVTGSPMGGGGLDYLGEDIAAYRSHYELKSDESEEDWKALIALCRTLKETPADKLEEALKPMLDVDGLLWFLALDCTLINMDGYWVRASDYSIYRDKDGKFHILPHDMNEAFSLPRGPGIGGFGPMMIRRRPGPDGGAAGGNGPRPGREEPPGRTAGTENRERPENPGVPAAGAERRPERGDEGPRGRPGGFGGGAGTIPAVKGVELDPMVGMDDARKPLRSKVLAVPALRERYLAHVRTIAEEWLDWKNLGPMVGRFRALIEKDVKADTRKLTSYEAFGKATADELPAKAENPPPEGPGGGGLSLRAFADQRRAYLLSLPAVREAGK